MQAYYAVKANPAPEIVRTLYKAGASFDVASLPEFLLVYENIKHLPAKAAAGFHLGQDHLRQPDQAQGDAARRWTSTSRWSPTTTSRSCSKIKRYAPHAGLVLRLRVPNTGSMVELSSKFGCDTGEAVDLILEAFRIGLVVEGLSFHVGSQCTNFDNFVQALNIAAAVMRRGAVARPRDQDPRHRRRLPGALRHAREAVPACWPRKINAEIDRLFPKDIEILAEPGRFLVATAATSVAQHHRQGRPRRQDVLLHRRQRLSHLLRHHLRPLPVSPARRSSKGETEICTVFGQTCDGMDTISQSEELPELEIDDLVYSENIGAYSNASATWFNGFPPAKVVHVNQ